ncbi:amidohydrolase family protein [Frankia sp. Cas3]|uniref:amidohydrolase family protein n=1 Tax=Frankia sp. Cas3 TaxID=3073926 RepID=UPI002AD386B3|nr:amidohydrolase family protein [Frankia sp. Cas3]
MLIRNAEINGRSGMSVRLRGDRIAAVGPELSREPGERVVQAGGGMLVPGLHDHHIHLLAVAAANGSVRCGPPAVRNREELAAALRAAATTAAAAAAAAAAATIQPGGWVRGIGYHDSVAGALTRADLDAMVADVPVRVQHRSGALWMLNSAAVAAIGIDDHAGARGAVPAAAPPGAGRGPDGRPDGRLFRLDGWLRERLPPSPAPDLAAVGRGLAGFGVTGVTDATVGTGPAEVELLTAAVTRGDLPQRLTLTGGPELAAPAHPRLRLGPVKIVIDDGKPVEFDELVALVRRARAAGRAVAVHCVTRAALVLTLAVLQAADDEPGAAHPGDRIEHGAVIPPDLLDQLVGRGLTVVTQPHFIAERGEQYLREVDGEDLPWLYRCAGLRRAGVAVAAGTDAPFGDLDPWSSMRAAVARRTAAGSPIGPDEAVDAATALALYLGDADRPGGPSRRIVPGAPADLCLLAAPGRIALRTLSADLVTLTIAAGHVVADNR